ncbi:hypothetical protein ZIOFF_048238 [Zingiber officinale]|uniref:Uncharacterized protein n=1 Tax=Zingiber officinale TaxID=94328 RepID=A0A8J5FUR5_ZINOF|nr:hypothetical protein ZIOFF_048238 [Zingiber officinale]
MVKLAFARESHSCIRGFYLLYTFLLASGLLAQFSTHTVTAKSDLSVLLLTLVVLLLMVNAYNLMACLASCNRCFPLCEFSIPLINIVGTTSIFVDILLLQIQVLNTHICVAELNNQPHRIEGVSNIKSASVKLAMKYLKKVSTELEVISGNLEEEEVMLQGVRFAFRAHQSKCLAFDHIQFAGGFDIETMRTFQELKDKAHIPHGQNHRQQKLHAGLHVARFAGKQPIL